MSKRIARLVLTATLFLLPWSPATALAAPAQPTDVPALWERLTAPFIDLWGKLFQPEPAVREPASVSDDHSDNRGGLDPWGHE
jgi:hypothetical protein